MESGIGRIAWKDSLAGLCGSYGRQRKNCRGVKKGVGIRDPGVTCATRIALPWRHNPASSSVAEPEEFLPEFWGRSKDAGQDSHFPGEGLRGTGLRVDTMGVPRPRVPVASPCL